MFKFKLMAAAAICAVGSLLCFGCMARAGDKPSASAAWAWATCRPDDKECNNATAAWAWSKALPCECNGAGPDCPCKPRPTAGDLGYEWRARAKDVLLVKPKQCNGTFCTPEQIIGGWADGVFRTWNGRAWSDKPAELPCQPPGVQEAAALVAAALIGLTEELGDVAQTTQTTVTTSTVMSTSPVGEAVYIAEARRRIAPVRRLLSLPIRAIRSRRANYAVAVPVEVHASAPVVNAAPTTMRTYGWVQTGEYQLQPVTTSVPVTRYQWVPVEAKPPPVPAKK